MNRRAAKTQKYLKALEEENKILTAQSEILRKRGELGDPVLWNSLTSLAQNMSNQVVGYAQAPITSFGPLLTNNVYAPLTINWTVLMYAYKSISLAQIVCDMPVLDAMRGGIDIICDQLSSDEKDELSKQFDMRGAKPVVETAVWSRLFGGSGLIVATEKDLDVPLTLEDVAKGGVDFYSANRWELVSAWKDSPTYNFYGRTVDSTRCLLMNGKTAPYTIAWQLAGWGLSELERLLEDINVYLRVKNLIYAMLYEAKVDVYKFKDFAGQMITAQGEQKTNQRLQAMNALKNYSSALLLDKEDDYIQKQLSFAGIAEIYRESRIEVASSARIPMTKLFGLPASGFSTNEDDMEIYNAMLESEVRPQLKPVIVRVLELLAAELFGDEFEIDIRWNPLRVLGAVEEETIRASKLKRVTDLLDRGLITAEAAGELIKDEEIFVNPPEILEGASAGTGQFEFPGIGEAGASPEAKAAVGLGA